MEENSTPAASRSTTPSSSPTTVPTTPDENKHRQRGLSPAQRPLQQAIRMKHAMRFSSHSRNLQKRLGAAKNVVELDEKGGATRSDKENDAKEAAQKNDSQEGNVGQTIEAYEETRKPVEREHASSTGEDESAKARSSASVTAPLATTAGKASDNKVIRKGGSRSRRMSREDASKERGRSASRSKGKNGRGNNTKTKSRGRQSRRGEDWSDDEEEVSPKTFEAGTSTIDHVLDLIAPDEVDLDDDLWSVCSEDSETEESLIWNLFADYSRQRKGFPKKQDLQDFILEHMGCADDYREHACGTTRSRRKNNDGGVAKAPNDKLPNKRDKNGLKKLFPAVSAGSEDEKYDEDGTTADISMLLSFEEEGDQCKVFDNAAFAFFDLIFDETENGSDDDKGGCKKLKNKNNSPGKSSDLDGNTDVASEVASEMGSYISSMIRSAAESLPDEKRMLDVSVKCQQHAGALLPNQHDLSLCKKEASSYWPADTILFSASGEYPQPRPTFEPTQSGFECELKQWQEPLALTNEVSHSTRDYLDINEVCPGEEIELPLPRSLYSDNFIDPSSLLLHPGSESTTKAVTEIYDYADSPSNPDSSFANGWHLVAIRTASNLSIPEQPGPNEPEALVDRFVEELESVATSVAAEVFEDSSTTQEQSRWLEERSTVVISNAKSVKEFNDELNRKFFSQDRQASNDVELQQDEAADCGEVDETDKEQVATELFSDFATTSSLAISPFEPGQYKAVKGIDFGHSSKIENEQTKSSSPKTQQTKGGEIEKNEVGSGQNDKDETRIVPIDMEEFDLEQVDLDKAKKKLGVFRRLIRTIRHGKRQGQQNRKLRSSGQEVDSDLLLDPDHVPQSSSIMMKFSMLEKGTSRGTSRLIGRSKDGPTTCGSSKRSLTKRIPAISRKKQTAGSSSPEEDVQSIKRMDNLDFLVAIEADARNHISKSLQNRRQRHSKKEDSQPLSSQPSTPTKQAVQIDNNVDTPETKATASSWDCSIDAGHSQEQWFENFAEWGDVGWESSGLAPASAVGVIPTNFNDSVRLEQISSRTKILTSPRQGSEVGDKHNQWQGQNDIEGKLSRHPPQEEPSGNAKSASYTGTRKEAVRESKWESPMNDDDGTSGDQIWYKEFSEWDNSGMDELTVPIHACE